MIEDFEFFKYGVLTGFNDLSNLSLNDVYYNQKFNFTEELGILQNNFFEVTDCGLNFLLEINGFGSLSPAQVVLDLQTMRIYLIRIN